MSLLDLLEFRIPQTKPDSRFMNGDWKSQKNQKSQKTLNTSDKIIIIKPPKE